MQEEILCRNQSWSWCICYSKAVLCDVQLWLLIYFPNIYQSFDCIDFRSHYHANMPEYFLLKDFKELKRMYLPKLEKLMKRSWKALFALVHMWDFMWKTSRWVQRCKFWMHIHWCLPLYVDCFNMSLKCQLYILGTLSSPYKSTYDLKEIQKTFTLFDMHVFAIFLFAW